MKRGHIVFGGLLALIMTTAADEPVKKYFARAHLGPPGLGGPVAPADPNMPTDPVDNPPPVDPRDKADEDSDDFAAYVRQTGARVFYAASRTPQSATDLASIGLADNVFDYSPYGGGPGFPKSNGKTFYMISLDPSPKGEEICRKIDRLSGGSGNVGAYGGLDLNRADEGCGGESFSLRYWKRIDPAQQAAQVAVYIRNAQLVYQAVAKAGYVPDNVSEFNLNLNYYGLGGPRGSGFSYPAQIQRVVFSEATISDEGLCRAINVKGGGSANVGSYGNDGRNRTFGCGGDSGSMTMWYRIDPAFSASQAAAVESFTSQVVTIAKQNGGGNTQAGRDSINSFTGTWYNTGYNNGSGARIGSVPNYVNYKGWFYVLEMRVTSEAVCQVLATKYGQGTIGAYNGRDYEKFVAGCGGESGTFFFWVRA